MHESHWGLTESPFRSAVHPKYFYESPTHEEALARLQFLIDNRRRVGLLVGANGCGKSMVLRVLGEQARKANHQVVLVSMLGIDVTEFLWSVAVQLGLNPPSDLPRFGLWRLIVDRLIENRYQQVTTLFLLDDAEQADSDVMLQALRFLHADPSPESRVTMILSSSPAGAAQLDERVLELSELKIELEPWDEDDTAAFLDTCLTKAGRMQSAFEPAAASELCKLTGGVPRRISQLAELALLAGAGQDAESVDADLIASVYEELCVGVGS